MDQGLTRITQLDAEVVFAEPMKTFATECSGRLDVVEFFITYDCLLEVHNEYGEWLHTGTWEQLF
jgi:hypothetical protein